MQAIEHSTIDAKDARIVELEVENAALKEERDRLRESRDALRVELQLLARRIFVAKAERVDTAQLELEFAQVVRKLDELSALESKPERAEPRKPRPHGRRDLRSLPLEEERVEIPDPALEALVDEGKAVRIGFEESCKLAYKRGGMRRLVIARIKYQATDAQNETAIETAPMPAEILPRSVAAPSLLAHILMAKYGEGLPLFRLEERFARDGVPLDRGMMCRWVEEVGATFGATVITGARADAFRNAFCIATDATGIAVQPIATHDKKSQACQRGHFFVQIFDRDHIFFEYTAKETSAVVKIMFAGHSGYIQADAKSVYDTLFRNPDDPDDPDELPSSAPIEVACWAHARRGFFEAALGKEPVAREALLRVGRIFDHDAQWAKSPPSEIFRLRNTHLRPEVDDFFEFVNKHWERVKDQRGKLRSALGYMIRQKNALLRFFDNGRLLLDNNRSERALRTIAVGRKAWLFVGSDDHAHATGHILSLIASAKLHRLDPEAYLRDLLRVLALWPKDRFVELAPKYWAATRARLCPTELAREVGPLTIPAPQL